MSTKNTQGFYKTENGVMYRVPDHVYGSEYELDSTRKDSYRYPVNGWWWFDSKEEAQAILGVSSTQYKAVSLE